MADREHTRPRHLVVAAVLGLGLVAAPAIFQMFSRAPSGGQMIDEFEPYMTQQVIGGFADDLALIDRAVNDIAPAAAELPDSVRTTYFDQLATQWPGVYDDMGGMLATMDGNIDNFGAVRSLPPFPLFPWFFVIPGVLVAGFAVFGWRSRRGRVAGIGLLALGIGLVAAPAVFQMFTRAPKGADMIDDFRPLMTKDRVQTMQGYFLVIGAGEGNLRNDIVPALSGSDSISSDVATFSSEWPRISNDMAPMIGAMSDNLDNFGDVDALPPFGLFPWFFVIPGLGLAALGIIELRRVARTATRSDATTTHTPTLEPTLTTTLTTNQGES